MSNTFRLDVELVNRNLAPSREVAKKLVLASLVLLNGKIVTKPSLLVSQSDELEVCENDVTKYVSRGAFKLKAALEHFSIDVKGFVAADFGASTGGFTDLLLQRGASKVFAIENGSGQLHSRLVNDKRVVSIENVNARFIEVGFIPLCDIVVMDVSFISQTKLFKSVANVLKKDGYFVSLIKPQFELSKLELNKKGIVKDKRYHDLAVKNVLSESEIYNFYTVGVIESPIMGGDGNKEFLACFKYKGE